MNKKAKFVLILSSIFILGSSYADTFVSDETTHLLNEVTKKHFNGAVTESFVNGFFKSNGFSKIDAEVGRTGIDGLFIKRHEGKIVNVSVVESKFNSSPLGMTKKDGKQMSKQWILKKIQQKQESLQRQVMTKNTKKQLKSLTEIKKIVQNNKHNSLLFNITPVTEEYKALVKIKSPTKKQLDRLAYLSELARKNKLKDKFKTSINKLDKNAHKIPKSLDRYALANKEIDLSANYKKGTPLWKQKKLLTHSIRKTERLIVENKKLSMYLGKASKEPSKYNKLIKEQKLLIAQLQKSRPKLDIGITKKSLLQSETKMVKKSFKIPSLVMKKGNKSVIFMKANNFKKASKVSAKLFNNVKYFKNIKAGDIVMLTIVNGTMAYSILKSGISYKKVSKLLFYNSRQVIDGVFFRCASVIAPPTGFVLAVGGTIVMSYVIDKYIELDNRQYLAMNDLFFDIPDEIKHKITLYSLDDINRESVFELNNSHKKTLFDEDVNNNSIFDNVKQNNDKSIFDN